MNKRTILLLTVSGVIILLGAGCVNGSDNGGIAGVKNFEECAAAKHPILESYPRQCRTPDGRIFVEEISADEGELSDKIRLKTPVRGQEVKSPLRVAGEARGSWYFEADFPVHIEDGYGRVLGQGPARAEAEWMTEQFVPFSMELTFAPSQTREGTLVLSRSNPSGLVQNENELRIPIVFSDFTPVATMTVRVYFSNSKLQPEGSVDCGQVYAVERTVPKSQAVARAALEQLLRGPLSDEKEDGYQTSINPGTRIQSLAISNGVAKVDFSERLNDSVAGSCRVQAIRAQIERTLKEFAAIKEVEISVNGESEEILQP